MERACPLIVFDAGFLYGVFIRASSRGAPNDCSDRAEIVSLQETAERARHIGCMPALRVFTLSGFTHLLHSDKQQQLSKGERELKDVTFPAFNKDLVSGSLGNFDLQQPPESDSAIWTSNLQLNVSSLWDSLL